MGQKPPLTLKEWEALRTAEKVLIPPEYKHLCTKNGDRLPYHIDIRQSRDKSAGIYFRGIRNLRVEGFHYSPRKPHKGIVGVHHDKYTEEYDLKEGFVQVTKVFLWSPDAVIPEPEQARIVVLHALDYWTIGHDNRLLDVLLTRFGYRTLWD